MNKKFEFTLAAKNNGEVAAARLTGFAAKYYSESDPLTVYETSDGLYYVDDTKTVHGSYTLEELQEEFEELHFAGEKALYYVVTNGYDMVVYNDHGAITYHTQDDGFPVNPDEEIAAEFLEDWDVDNVNPWLDDCTAKQLFDGVEILAKVDL